jgi:hypothetical protein
MREAYYYSDKGKVGVFSSWSSIYLNRPPTPTLTLKGMNGK